MKKGLMLFLVVVAFWTMANYFNSNKKSALQEPSRSEQTEQLPRIGFRAPDFKLQGLDEEVYTMPTPNRKPVVVNFWASWCGPCRLEAPELVKLYDKYKDEVEIYAVNLTSSDSIKGAQAFADEFEFSFPVLLDLDGSIGSRYQVQAVPTTFFVNDKGIIVDQVTGLAPREQLEQKFQKLIK